MLKKVDPTQAQPAVRLKPRAKDRLPPSQTLFGRVLDARKRPVAGAEVRVQEMTIGNTTYGRLPEGTDVAAVSDSAGEFEIYVAKPFDSLGLRIAAPGLARTRFAAAAVGDGARSDFVLPAGAALVGRVVRDGKPVTRINVGVASEDREVGSFTGDFVVGTDTNGVFVFPNLPADRGHQFYGVMDSLRGIGALPARVVRVGKEGSRTDLAVISLTPGWRVAGEVRVANTNMLPVGSRLMLFRDGAWDFSVIDLPANGRFDVPSVPGEAVSLSVGMTGYRAAAGQPKLGRLESDRTGLALLMEPGKEGR